MSKISAQSQSGTIQDFAKALAKKPIAWKLIGNAVDMGVARFIRDHSPDTKIILRAADDNWALDQSIDSYAQRAMAKAQPFLDAGLCDFLESPNEPIIWNDVDARRLNELQVDFATAYKLRGFRCLGYPFPVGNPPYDLWRYLNDGILACDGWVGMHQYGAPTIQSGAADLSLRHRKVLPLLSPEARKMFKVIIGEAGIDLGIGRNPPDGLPTAGGYRKLPQQGDSEDYWIDNYLSQLTWWDAELAKDSYVVAATIFGYGMEKPWDNENLKFDVAGVDTDRAKFIAWLSEGHVNLTPPIVNPPYSGRVPFAGGYKLTQAYGANPTYYAGLGVGIQSHEGADLIPLDADWLIHAIEPGTVVLRSTIGNYGNHVVIWNPATARLWWYCHLESFVIAAGQPVGKGQPIGVMGKSGNTQGAHLHLGLQMADAAGKATNTNNGNLGYIDPMPALEGTIGEPLMSTPQERINAAWESEGVAYNPDAAFPKRARELKLGRAVANEYGYKAADGKAMAGQGFDAAFLECVKGDWGNIKAYDWLTGEPWTAPVNVPPVGQPPQVGGVLPYAFPQALTDIGAMGVEGQRVPGSPFYRIAGASVRRGISALMVATVIGKGGTPVIGAKVVNQFPDGNGEIVETDGSGNARFQFGASSAFTNPGSGPFTLFVADVSAFKDSDSSPKRVVFKNKLSDTVKSLGDYQAEHTEIYLQFVEQPS